MGSDLIHREKKIYKVVLTGGPCGGKTTGQARLCSFFEKLGWKVLRVPETATVLLGGGIKFSELTIEQGVKFQEELLRTMIQIENTFFNVAEALDRDVIVICDRGTMDASAFIDKEQWEDILQRNNWNDVDLRDNRYNQVIHMVSAANGAEKFYSIEEHACRSEGLDMAKERDVRAAQAWVGHPYFDMIDNSTDFETKLNRMIQSVCMKLGIDVRDRLENNSRKVKFLVKGPLPPDDEFPVEFRDFNVVHNYLRSSGINGSASQGRLRKRGYKNHWIYTHTIRRPLHGQSVEVKTTLTARDYALMLTQADMNHNPVYKTRRCFLLNDQYFQMDVYRAPLHPRCAGLILLETYTTLTSEELYQRLPNFLTIVKEVTGDPRYSMFNLSLKEGWENNKHFSSLRWTTPNTNGHSNGISNSSSNGAIKNETENERNESFLACCDEKSVKHHMSNGCCGINGSMNGCRANGSSIPVSPGSGKYKGYENGHATNGISSNGYNSKSAPSVNGVNGTSNGKNGH